MRKNISIAIMMALAVTAFGQTSTTKRPTTTAKPSASASHKAAVPVVAGPPKAVLMTSMGNITCELFPKQAPETVANFVGLARGTKAWTDSKTGKKMVGKPLYDGTIFHRVIPNFMIQGGDPLGTGEGDPGYRFKDEFDPSLAFDKPGRLAMANSGPGTNGSQFFITEVPTQHLNNHHTIFGQCDNASVELVKKIAQVDRDPQNDKPFLAVVLKHVTITGIPGAPVAKPAAKPAAKTPMKPTVKH